MDGPLPPASAATLPPRPPLDPLARLRRRAGAFLTDGMFLSLAHGTRFLSIMQPQAHGLELLADQPYVDDGSPFHRLDVYRPLARSRPSPVIVYIHGGGFRFMSKETHRVFALAFARRGYVVVSVNYRLAPRDPFPAAHADVCAAYLWVVRHAAELGADPSRIAVAGDSAGANLAAALTVAACLPRPEPWARAVYDAGVVPKAALPAYGILQVSDPERFPRARPTSIYLQDRISEVGDAYLGPVLHLPARELEMADPLCLIEQTQTWPRQLPPFFAPVGTADRLIDDTRRLEAALHRLGVVCDARYYRGEMHGFNGIVVLPNARRCWRDTYAFLDTHHPAQG